MDTVCNQKEEKRMTSYFIFKKIMKLFFQKKIKLFFFKNENLRQPKDSTANHDQKSCNDILNYLQRFGQQRPSTIMLQCDLANIPEAIY